MAEIRHFPGFQATWENVARKVAPGGQLVPSAEKYCVYNQTRGRFVATSVEAVDASEGGQEARLRSLEPGAGGGLWLLPCPEISPTSIRFLVDLVYLNRDGAVLAAVESFPLVNAAVSSAMAGSVLVLAENTVAAGEIHIGDRLIVAAPDEMKRHLQSLKEAKAAAQQAAPSTLEQHPLSSPEGQAAGAAENPETTHPRADVASAHGAADRTDPELAQSPAHASTHMTYPASMQPSAAASSPVVSSPVPPDGVSMAMEKPVAPRLDAAEQAKADRFWAASAANTPAAPAYPSQGAGEWARSLAEPARSTAATQPPRAFDPQPRAFQPLPPAVQQGASIYQPPPSANEPSQVAPAPPYSASPEIPAGAPAAKQEPAPAPQADPNEWKKKKQAKGWFARMLQGEPEDARVTTRESLPGLIAYYFTGGTPQPHAVRDISLTGMYILTEERWYPGTVVRVTLTDRSKPTTERSITVNAKAVRSGSDGVGFEFVLEERDRSKIRPGEWMDQANGMYVDQVQEFLRVYKS